MERNGGSLTGRDARTTNSLPFHENRPEQRMELCLVGRQAQLTQIKDIEERSQLAADFVFVNARRAVLGLLFCIAGQREPERTVARDAFQDAAEGRKIDAADVMIDAAVKEHI